MLEEHLFAQFAVPGLNVVTQERLQALRVVRAIRESLFQVGYQVLNLCLFGGIDVLAFLHLAQRPVRGKTICEAVSIDQD